MTFSPLAFTHSNVDLVTDADLAILYPNIAKERWAASTTLRVQIVEAWAQMLRDLAAMGYSSAQIDDTAENQAFAKQATIHGALILCFRAWLVENGDRWHILMNNHQAKYDKLIQGADLDYDADDDDVTDDAKAAYPVEFVR